MCLLLRDVAGALAAGPGTGYLKLVFFFQADGKLGQVLVRLGTVERYAIDELGLW